jgi:UDP-glucose 4-epimerase
MEQPLEDFQLGPALTFEILEAMRRSCPRARLVYLSSAAVYGNPARLPVTESAPVAPISPYGFHRWLSEQICLEFTAGFGMPTTVARIFSAYGPGQRKLVSWEIAQQLVVERRCVLRGSGQETRDFIHVRDLAAALELLALRAPGHAEVFNVASGREVSIAEVARCLQRHIAPSAELLFEGRTMEGIPQRWWADISALEALGFEPGVELEAGLGEVARWCREALGR